MVDYNNNHIVVIYYRLFYADFVTEKEIVMNGRLSFLKRRMHFVLKFMNVIVPGLLATRACTPPSPDRQTDGWTDERADGRAYG